MQCMMSHSTVLPLGVTVDDTSVNAEKGSRHSSSRRPDIDLLRVSLTWAILLFHVVLIYAPFLFYYVR